MLYLQSEVNLDMFDGTDCTTHLLALVLGGRNREHMYNQSPARRELAGLFHVAC
jgi:hypothetical protein